MQVYKGYKRSYLEVVLEALGFIYQRPVQNAVSNVKPFVSENRTFNNTQLDSTSYGNPSIKCKRYSNCRKG